MAIDRRSMMKSVLCAGAAIACGSRAPRPQPAPPPPVSSPPPVSPALPSGPPYAAPLDDETHAIWREALLAARKRQLVRLRAYAGGRRFPRNHRIFGETPVFVDPDGIPCAVAYLMIESGSDALVQRIAETDNHVRIGTLAGGPVVDWILRSGLMQMECADIQPTYRFEDPEQLRMRRLERHFEEVIAELERATNAIADDLVSLLGPEISSGIVTLEQLAR
jgi:hypothetical protein